jgi:hypothetical protein
VFPIRRRLSCRLSKSRQSKERHAIVLLMPQNR